MLFLLAGSFWSKGVDKKKRTKSFGRGRRVVCFYGLVFFFVVVGLVGWVVLHPFGLGWERGRLGRVFTRRPGWFLRLPTDDSLCGFFVWREAVLRLYLAVRPAASLLLLSFGQPCCYGYLRIVFFFCLGGWSARPMNSLLYTTGEGVGIMGRRQGAAGLWVA